jgi:hypothetical protein
VPYSASISTILLIFHGLFYDCQWCPPTRADKVGIGPARRQTGLHAVQVDGSRTDAHDRASPPIPVPLPDIARLLHDRWFSIERLSARSILSFGTWDTQQYAICTLNMYSSRKATFHMFFMFYTLYTLKKSWFSC